MFLPSTLKNNSDYWFIKKASEQITNQFGENYPLKNILIPMITWHGRWNKWPKNCHNFPPPISLCISFVIWFCHPAHQDVRSISNPLNLGWSCDLLCPIKCRRNKVMGVLSLGLNRPYSFCSHFLVSPWEEAWSSPLKDERSLGADMIHLSQGPLDPTADH